MAAAAASHYTYSITVAHAATYHNVDIALPLNTYPALRDATILYFGNETRISTQVGVKVKVTGGGYG